MPQDLIQVHARIKGRVQGVGFRYWTQRTAESLSLGGWVMNMPDGSVEAAFEGTREQVEKMVAAARKGPQFGKVDDIELVWRDSVGEFKEFEVRY